MKRQKIISSPKDEVVAMSKIAQRHVDPGMEDVDECKVIDKSLYFVVALSCVDALRLCILVLCGIT